MPRRAPPPILSAVSIRLGDVFGDHMVFQRDRRVAVWGSGEPGRTVEVSFSGRSKSTRVERDGAWSVLLEAMRENTRPEDMEARYRGRPGMSESTLIHDILVGDVWFCSGQSNMELGISAAENGAEEAMKADFPLIRYLLLNKTSAAVPTERIQASWKVCTPRNVVQDGWGGLSAVAYNFAVRVQAVVGVPLAIIQSAFGGSRIHPWINPEVLGRHPSLRRFREELLHAEAKHRRDLLSAPDAEHPFQRFKEWDQLKPAGTYNAMVHPLIRFPIKGVLWYQGESDVGDGTGYLPKMKALIEGFRRAWKDASLPFYFAQVAPWSYGKEEDLPRLWEAQYAAESIRNTAMAVTVDVGDAKDIHPVRKKPVGERLAFLALNRTYGRKGIPCRGPMVTKVSFKDGEAAVLFEAGGDLATRDGKPPACFQVAGEDRVFHEARAEARGKVAIVRSERVNHPVSVRYAWYGTADAANLCDTACLPARPFRTDRW